MKLKQAIKESEIRAAALYLEQSRSLYVVAQYGPFTFPDNFIDVHYTTEIHRYTRQGHIDFAIINFNPVNWIQLGLSLGAYVNDDGWFSYGNQYTENDVKRFRRRGYRKVNPRFRNNV